MFMLCYYRLTETNQLKFGATYCYVVLRNANPNVTVKYVKKTFLKLHELIIKMLTILAKITKLKENQY